MNVIGVSSGLFKLIGILAFIGSVQIVSAYFFILLVLLCIVVVAALDLYRKQYIFHKSHLSSLK